jgi:hypothetical protein
MFSANAYQILDALHHNEFHVIHKKYVKSALKLKNNVIQDHKFVTLLLYYHRVFPYHTL